jgi:hypothetical protein
MSSNIWIRLGDIDISRAINLKLSIDEVTRKCEASGVSISVIELLPSGDTHLVCTTGDGAATIRHKYARHIIDGPQKRFPFQIPPSRW